MKIKILLLITCFLTATLSLSAYEYWQKEKAIGKISFFLGNVLVLPKGAKKMEKAGFNHKLYPGDKVRTEKQARCEIKYNDGSIVRIAEQSIYTIDKVQLKEKERKVESSLSLGSLWANIKKLASKTDNWLLRSPTAVVAVRGTIYRMETQEDKSSKVLVYDGSVNVGPPAWSPGGAQGMNQQGGAPHYVQGPAQVQGPKQVTLEEWVEIVKAQQQIIVKPDGSYQKSDFNLADDAKSDWVKWNLERDKLVERN